MDEGVANHGPGFVLDDLEYASYLIPSLDMEAHLIAITSVIRRNEQADRETRERIAELEAAAKETTGWRNSRLVDDWVDELHYSVYHDAAISMSAVGMYVPLIESLLGDTFRSLGIMYAKSAIPLPRHARWSNPNPDGVDLWNHQIFVGSSGPRPDVILGVQQLCQASGLDQYFDPDDMEWLELLFQYRNRMFHMGFEWPMEARRRFAATLERRGWEQHFSKSTSDGEPWIFSTLR